jgi:hemoglobin-like flavoprotein
LNCRIAFPCGDPAEIVLAAPMMRPSFAGTTQKKTGPDHVTRRRWWIPAAGARIAEPKDQEFINWLTRLFRRLRGGGKPMDAQQVALVQQSFDKVAGLGAQVADIFYKELFAIDPSLRSMFNGNMQEQKKKLLTTLALVVGSLHTPAKILKPAQNLAIKHLDYGVQAEHYTLVGNALLRTLRKGLGADYTPEVDDAWVEAIRTLAGIMKGAAYGNAAVKGAA